MTMKIKERLSKAVLQERLTFTRRKDVLDMLAFWGYTHKDRVNPNIFFHQLDFDKQSFPYMVITRNEEEQLFYLERVLRWEDKTLSKR